jgi:hypothetical protein
MPELHTFLYPWAKELQTFKEVSVGLFNPDKACGRLS